MSEFVKGNHLNKKLDDILDGANTRLILISPFIKFHARVKEILLSKKSNDKLYITVVFGKNEDKKEKSFAKEDYEFLKQFPKVDIYYEPRLHAKYYANETSSLLSSMNLYEYSQNNNIEFGIFSESGLVDSLIGSNTQEIEENSSKYFKNVIEQSEVMFMKRPVYEDKLMGLTKKYVRSEVEVDKLKELYDSTGKKETSQKKSDTKNSVKEKSTLNIDAKTNIDTNVKLLSASKIASKYGSGISTKNVNDLMEKHGFIMNNQITETGKALGLVEKNYMGNTYIAYPEDLDVFNKL